MILAIAAGCVLVLLTAFVLVVRLRRRHGRSASGLDEDVEPMRVERELSPVVERMLGAPTTSSRRLSIPPRAGFAGRLPGPGVLQVAGVNLPNGRPTRPIESAAGDSPHAQLWVASTSAPADAASWKLLAAGFADSGLWPLLLISPPGASATASSWFDDPAHRASPTDPCAPALAFAQRLEVSLSGGSPLASTRLLAASNVARGQLARASGRRTDALDVALRRLSTARLALVACRRPADAMDVLAWPGADDAGIPPSELADLLGSWEERYGALLIGLGERSLQLAILRPPATFAEAVEALAEQHALCPDEADGWADDEQGARGLIDAAVWTLSWH